MAQLNDGLGVAEIARQAYQLTGADDRRYSVIVLNRNKNLVSHQHIVLRPGRTP